MIRNNTDITEYGRPPGDHPVTKEPRLLPPEWEGSYGAPEYAPPGPEFPAPGSLKGCREDEEKKRRLARRRFMKLLSAAAILLLFFFRNPKAAYTLPEDMSGTEDTAAATPVPDVEKTVYTDITGGEYDPALNIIYAVRDGDTVRYSYYALTWLNGNICPVDVYQMAYSPVTGYEARPENDPDRWEGSRDSFDYAIPVDPDEDSLQLVLTGKYLDEAGNEKTIRAVRDICDLPPEPAMSAEFTADFENLDFRGSLVPREGDSHVYDFEISEYDFNFMIYKADGENFGGWRVHEDDIPDIIAPGTITDGEPSKGYTFVYKGPYDSYFPDEAVKYGVSLRIRDKSTGYYYTLVTEPQDIVKRVYHEPECEITAFNFYSEMHAGITFAEMDDVTKVTLKVTDPDTGYVASTTDITEEAVSGLRYDVEPFYTDDIYEANEEYYSSTGSFPMTVRFDVTIEYDYEYGSREVTYSATTVEEPGFHCKYLADSEAVYDPAHAGCVMVGADATTDYTTAKVVIDDPEAVTGPGIISVKALYEGVPLDSSAYKIEHEEYDATFSGETFTRHISLDTCLIKRPSGVAESDGKEMTLEITHYLTSRGETYTSVIKIPFKPYE